jgi:hypothetical protein
MRFPEAFLVEQSDAVSNLGMQSHGLRVSQDEETLTNGLL